MKRTPIVIKVGGALLDDKAAAAALLDSIKAVMEERPVVLVHGGGPLVETLMASLGLTSAKIDGLRVTPDEHMPFICGALAGSANKSLCAIAIESGCTPVGLSLLDGNMVSCQPMEKKFGAVGTPKAENASLLKSILAQGLLPVVSSIGSSPQGRLLNINADQAATVIAQLIQGELLLLSNVAGVLDGDKQLLSELSTEDIEKYSQNGVITDGMKVKVDAALLAANSLSRPVTIASWGSPIPEILTNTTGTRVLPDSDLSGEAS
ncbi:acetylglutamate kinase [Alteromonas sp. H39]|uniref:acetylglutamate kinase n=1 Tax=Alteromonas sp. H39 TaxID=3389876 RepID=UPI0039DFC674